MSLRTKPNAPLDTITHALRRSFVTPMPVDNRRLMTIGRPSKTVMHSYGAARRALPAQRALLQVGIEAGWQMLRQLFSTTVRNAEADRIAAPALMSVPGVARKLWSAQWKVLGLAHGFAVADLATTPSRPLRHSSFLSVAVQSWPKPKPCLVAGSVCSAPRLRIWLPHLWTAACRQFRFQRAPCLARRRGLPGSFP